MKLDWKERGRNSNSCIILLYVFFGLISLILFFISILILFYFVFMYVSFPFLFFLIYGDAYNQHCQANYFFNILKEDIFTTGRNHESIRRGNFAKYLFLGYDLLENPRGKALKKITYTLLKKINKKIKKIN